MKTTTLLARRMLLGGKTSFVLSVIVSAFSVASTVVVFSVCARGISAFLTESRNFGEPPLTAAYNGLITMIVVTVHFFLFTFVGSSGSPPVADLFSEKASVETQPVLLMLLALCALTVSYITVKILFDVHKKKRRHFYSTLLSAGASPSFARECARSEGRYLCAWGVPAGLVLGYIGVLCFSAGEAVFCRVLSSGSGGGLTPDGIGFSPAAGIAAALFGYIFITVRAGNAVRELTVKHTAAETREPLGANLGISIFTQDVHNMKLFGLPHCIALRSIGDHIEKYAEIFFANALYMCVCGFSILDFFIVANYNGMQFGGEPDAAQRFLLASTFRFVSAAAAMQMLSVFGTFFAMISNFDSNTGCYALMRSLGSSENMIRSAVRREGALCVLIGGLCSTFCTVFLFCLLHMIYGRAAGLDLMGLLCALGGILVMTAVFAVGVAAAVRVTCRKIGKLDLIRELKEISNS